MNSNQGSRFVIKKEAVEKLRKENGESEEEFLLGLVDSAKKLARAPISKFYVGAVGLGKSGDVYLGSNLEFVGTPLYNTIHAEQFVVINAVQQGERELSAIAVSAAPCGHCRQFLSELNNAATIELIFQDGTKTNLKTLLPDRFKPEDVLGEEQIVDMMSPEYVASLKWTAASEQLLVDASESFKAAAGAAIKAAGKSYAPYSRCHSGVALILDSGEIASGGCIESCAYNPSVPPLQAAIVNGVALGKLNLYTEIKTAVLVEVEGNKFVSHWETMKTILNAISPNARTELLTAIYC